MTNVTEFTKKITSIFGDPDQAHTAIHHLEDLKQTKSAAVYATEFHCYAALVNWNNEALCHLFYKGLKETVKDDLAHRDKPDSLDDLIDLVIKLDNRLYE